EAQTEILESGLPLDASIQAQFINFYETLIQDYDIVAISGSIPPGLQTEIYHELIQIAKKQDKFVILDVNGKTLASVLQMD
ncbi:hypothetical protein L7Q77_34075, partial [Pseudomonas aeruginosa]